jgi:hypothetical protein
MPIGTKTGTMARPTALMLDFSLSWLPKVPSVPSELKKLKTMTTRTYDLAGPENEDLEAVPGLDQHVARARQVIGRQFHDEGRALAPQQGALDDHAGTDGGGDADQVKREDDVLAASGKKAAANSA